VLVGRAAGGDEGAFAVLVGRYGRPVLSLCYASTLSRVEAEDLAQEVFLAAWRNLPRFRAEAAFSTWLFALARNACVDRTRRLAARPQPAGGVEVGSVVEGADQVDRVMTVAIFVAASRLSLPLRQALLMRDVQGLSYREIALVQGVPVGTVRSRIAAARASIASELDA
jgi:RNA polymerase sigma-70 factor (ECF subfamily)